MGLAHRWPHLGRFCELAAGRPGIQVWLFGSALKSSSPSDLDVLVVYRDRADIVALREADWWIEFEPPLDIIAMTPEEESHYEFVAGTNAHQLV